MRSADLVPGEAYALGRYRSQEIGTADVPRVTLLSTETTAGPRGAAVYPVLTAEGSQAEATARQLLCPWAVHAQALADARRREAEAEERRLARRAELEAWQSTVNVRLDALGLPERAGKPNPGRVADGSAFRCVVLPADDLERLLTLAELGAAEANGTPSLSDAPPSCGTTPSAFDHPRP